MREPAWFRLYGRLPVAVQNLACSLAGIRMRRQRHGRVFREALEFPHKSQWWSAQELREYQDDQLRHIIQHAYETVPYYREVFDARRLKPNDIRRTEDLPKLPLLEKDTVRQRFDDLQSTTWPVKRRRYAKTGGTTGKALRLVLDKDTEPWHWAVHWRHRGHFGVRYGDEFVVFAGRAVMPLSNMNPPIWRRNLPMHQTYVSVHHMTLQNMLPLVEYLQRRRVAFYCGYPSALYLLGTFLLEQGIQLRHSVRAILTGSETLLPHQRRVLRQAFGADVGDNYAATECCVFISECEKHSYHVDQEFAAVEFLPLDGGPANVQRIVGTGFRNPAMPLIRYNIGDLATVTDRVCNCGRASPIVEKIDGRIESYIITPDGRRLGRLDFLFKQTHTIQEAQLIQDETDHVTVRIVRTAQYTPEDEAGLLQDMRRYLGNVIRIDVEYVAEVPREPNGKFRQIVSHVFRDRHQECATAGGTSREC